MITTAESTPLGFIASVSMIWWCFAGFETCCAMGEEIKYPQINIPRALMLAPFIVFAVNAAFQWFLVGIVPTSEIAALATASAPFAEAMKTAGILGFPLILLAAGIAFGGDFSTLNASIAVPPRYLFTMSRDGSMPKIFAKVHFFEHTTFVDVNFFVPSRYIRISRPACRVHSVFERQEESPGNVEHSAS